LYDLTWILSYNLYGVTGKL